ncbi:hypothetical protein C9374_005301 [Naegleria lovaniensis]|uniref:Uncharacterized protein n=1 Tax=Naegleria lovaniensis TaxID=51637 RepID=A0AA88GP55_NAELO|nr:uncharacterized protein C9374_005301 [Naegleria lovaniensis]KAG2382721.1 hypothetical protein C9374_005301 [Naegleria lovaniensis]
MIQNQKQDQETLGRVLLQFIEFSVHHHHEDSNRNYNQYYCQLLSQLFHARKNGKAFSGRFEILYELVTITSSNHSSNPNDDDELHPNGLLNSPIGNHHPIIEITEIGKQLLPVSVAYSKKHDLMMVVDRNACFYFFQKELKRFMNMFDDRCHNWYQQHVSHHTLGIVVESCENGCDYVIAVFSNNIRKYNMKWYFNSFGMPRLILIKKWIISEKDIQKSTKQKTFFRPNAAVVVKADKIGHHHNTLYATDGTNIHVFNLVNGKMLRTLQIGIPLFSIDYLHETSEFVLLSDENKIILYNETLQMITSTIGEEEDNALDTTTEQVLVDRASRNIICIGSKFQNAIIVISGVTRNPIHVYGKNDQTKHEYYISPQCACMDEMNGELIVADRRGRIIIFK